MKTIRLTEIGSVSEIGTMTPFEVPQPITINIERITAWGPTLSDVSVARILLDGTWHLMRESPEQITALIAQARALDFA